MTHPALAAFTPQVREWFGRAFEAPTPAQAQAWPAIATGAHTLISAPTGSGKTLAAFLWALDRLVAEPTSGRTRLVYVSPLKALSYDVEKNLRAPLRGIGADVKVAIRTGDTPQTERRDMVRHPPDILITTPESLYLILTRGARDLRGRRAGDRRRDPRRRADQARRAPRADARAAGGGRDLQRIGLSATQNPLEEIGRFLGGPKRTCTIVDTGTASRSTSRSTCRWRTWSSPSSATRDPTRLRPGGDPQVDLARDLPRAAARGPRAPVDDRVRQQPARRRAPRAAAQRAGRRADRPRPPRVARARGAARRRGAAQGRRAAVPGRDLVAGARHRHGRGRPGGAGRVAEVGHRRAAARRPRRPRRRRRVQGPHLPQVPRRPARVRRRRQTHARRRDREDRRAAQPARRARPADRGHGGVVRGSAPGGRGRTRSSRGRTRSRSCRARSSRTCSTCSPAATRRRSSPSCGRGSSGTAWPARSARARAPARWRSRTPARSPTAACSASTCPTAAGSASSTRRWSTRPARPGVPAGRVELADRGDHARPRRRLPGAGHARRGAVLEGRRRRAPARAGRGDRRVQPLGGRAGRRDARRRVRPRSPRRPEPDRVPGGAAGRDARRPDDRAIVVERFRDEIGDWRLCVLSPFGGRVHAAWGLALGARIREQSASSPTRCGPTTGSSSASPTQRSRRARSWSCSIPTSWRTRWSASSAARRCSPPASARTPGARS